MGIWKVQYVRGDEDMVGDEPVGGDGDVGEDGGLEDQVVRESKS